MENYTKKISLDKVHILILLKKHKTMRVVAKILGRSESSISKDLAKLRCEFEDVLFINTRHGFEPSHYLNEIYSELESSFFNLMDAVNKPMLFSPLEYRKTISIAVIEAEYERIVTLLNAELTKLFPQAKINFILWGGDSFDGILEGRIQCGVHLQNDHVSKHFFQKKLEADKIVVAVHKKFEVNNWAEIKSIPFIFVDVPGWNEFHYRFEDVLPPENRGDLKYKTRVDKLKSAIDIATQSKFAIQVPTKYLDASFLIIPYPKGVEFNIAYSFYCLQTEKNSLLLQHLYKLINSKCY